MKKFILVDGYVSMNNQQLFLDINNTKNDIKSRGGWLGVFLTLVGISVFNNFRSDSYFGSFFHYFDFGLRILGGFTIIAVLYYLFFLKKSKKKLIINEIKKIEIDKKEFESETSIIFQNNRQQDLNFRNLENQLEPFLDELKKRNSRIEIKNIN